MPPRFEVYEDNAGGLTLLVICQCGHVVYARSGYEHHPESVLEDTRELEQMTDIRDMQYWDKDDCYPDPEATRNTFKADPMNYKLVYEGDGVNHYTYRSRMGTAAKLAFEEGE